MSLVGNIVLNAFSAIILLILYFYYFYHSVTPSTQNKIFTIIIYTTLILLVFDSFGRMDGYPDTILPILNNISNFALFSLNPVLPSLWILFVYSYINQPVKINKKLFILLTIIVIINVILVIFSTINGWFYYIDSDNIYHRGSYFFTTPIISIILLISASVYVAIKYKMLGKKQFWVLHFFIIPPFICIILQMLIYGFSVVLNGVVISIIIVFLYIQNQSINIDYLTGIYNRKMLEILLNKKIKSSFGNKKFAAIMIDLDNFKYINDNYGHRIGDEALQTTVRLLKGCIMSRDYITRYGGDEFCIILDVTDKMSLENIVLSINKSIDNYNSNNNNLYKLGLSMGYSLYDPSSYMSVEEFLNKIDRHMYKNKNIDRKKKEVL